MMRFNPAAFNAHLNHIGQKMKWRKAFRCPCFNPHSRAARPGCPHCGGKSWMWVDPVDTVAGVAGQDIQLKWAQFGLWEDGDTVVTIPENSPMYEAGQFDRMVMLNATDHFSVPLTRGDPSERLFNLAVERVLRVFWLEQDGKIVEGGIPSVEPDGSLVWGANAPPLGTQYSLSGTRYNEYFCWGPFPADRNQHQGARLPRRVVLRRFDLFGRDV